MGRVPWSEEEDDLLRKCIAQYGEGKWHRVPLLAGLNRCRKSCRLRWLNYLRPDVKRGSFADDEIDLIIKLHKLLGNRWSLIAARLPGRTANDVKNFWNCHLRRKLNSQENLQEETPPLTPTSLPVAIKTVPSPPPPPPPPPPGQPLRLNVVSVQTIRPEARDISAPSSSRQSEFVNYPESLSFQPIQIEGDSQIDTSKNLIGTESKEAFEAMNLDFGMDEFSVCDSGGGSGGGGGDSGGEGCSKLEWEDWSLDMNLWNDSFWGTK